MATYLDAQIGMVDEVTFGTYVAPTRFYEFTGETLKAQVDRIWSNGVRSGRRTRHRFHLGAERVTGDFTVELAPQGIGLLLKHIFGTVTSTTSGAAYTHTFTPGVIDGKSFTLQKALTDSGGTTRALSYTGCKVTEWEMAGRVGELVTLRSSVYGIHEDTSQSVASVSYPTNWTPFVFTNASLTVAGSAIDVREFTLTGDNGLTVDRHRMSATTPSRSKEPKEANVRPYTGTLVADFDSLTAYNRVFSGSEVALVITLSQATYASLVITTQVEFDGETPVFERDVLAQPLPFSIEHATSDASAFTAVLTNLDSTP